MQNSNPVTINRYAPDLSGMLHDFACHAAGLRIPMVSRNALTIF